MSYTEFFISAAGDHRNGGSSSGPAIEMSTCVDPQNSSVIVDVLGGGWYGAAVGDWICWDIDGLRERARVVAIAGDEATVSKPLTTDGSAKVSRVKGAFPSLQFAMNTVDTTLVNAAGDPPRINVPSSSICESVATSVPGTASIPITVEAYHLQPGDLRGTNTRTAVQPGSVPDVAAFIINHPYIIIRNMDVQVQAAGKDGFYINSDYSTLINCRAKAPRSAISVSYKQHCVIQSCLFEESGTTAYACAELNAYNSKIINNTVRNSLPGAKGATLYPSGTIIAFNRFVGNATSGVLLTAGRGAFLFNDIADNGGAGLDIGLNLDLPGSVLFGNNIAFNHGWGVAVGGTTRRYFSWGDWNNISNNASGQVQDVTNGGPLLATLEHTDLINSPYTGASAAQRQANGYELSAAAKAIASPRGDDLVSRFDLGAVQSAPPASTGGLLVHGGMTGGMPG